MLRVAFLLMFALTSLGCPSPECSTDADCAEDEVCGEVDGQAACLASGNGDGDGDGDGDGGPPDGGQGDPDAGSLGSPDGGGDGTSPSYTDPNCTDGQYSEPFSNQDDDVSALMAAYIPGANPEAAATQLIVDVLENRYPVGAYLVEQGFADGAFDNCSIFFIDDLGDAESVIAGASGAVHECGHAVNLSPSVSAFVFTESLQFACEGGSFYDAPAPPARELLGTDPYNALWPACSGGQFQNCDIYQDVYFDNQAFTSLLEELLQYINDTATSYAVDDLPGPYLGIERTGAITMLWWLQRYLKIMRTNPTYTPVYNSLMADQCWRDMVLSTWSRGWAFLDATASEASTEEMTLQGFIEDPDLLEEIQRVRDLEGCL